MKIRTAFLTILTCFSYNTYALPQAQSSPPQVPPVMNIRGASMAPIAKPANSLSASDFGVKINDASFDNTKALQDGLNAAKASRQTLWLGPGTYYYNSSITADSVALIGSGAGTILQATSYINYAFTLTGSGPSLSNVAFQVSAPVRSSQPKDCSVLISFATKASVVNVSVQGASANGIRVDHSSESTVENNYINGCCADGIALVNKAEKNLISGNQIMNGGDDSLSSNSYPFDSGLNSGNIFQNNYAGPNHWQGRGFALMGSIEETVRNCVSKGSMWHGIIAGTDPNSNTLQGKNAKIIDNLVFDLPAGGLPVMITDDGGKTATDRADAATVTGTKTSGDVAAVLGWTPRTDVVDPKTFTTYPGGGPGSGNTPGNQS